MRVISGSARGKNLESLEGLSTRPTIDRVKEGIFSSIQFLVPGARVLDLFAGSGQMGIECLSRGALKGVFVDSNKDAVNVVIKNIKACGLFDKARVVNMNAQDYLGSCKDEFDIIFLDPPYREGLYEKCFELIREYDLLAEEGIIIAEHGEREPLPEEIEDYILLKERTYGSIVISIYG